MIGYLRAAAEAFAEHGLERAKIDQISLAAGLGKGTVYNYFASKEELFLSVIETACARTAAIAAARPAVTTAERLRALVAADVRWAAQNGPFARVLLRETFAAKPTVYAKILAAAAPYLQAVTNTLERGQQRGEVREDTPVAQQVMLFTGLIELCLAQHFALDGWPQLDEIPDLVVRQFIEGMGPRSKREWG